VLVVGGVLAVGIHRQVTHYGHDLTGFVQFGSFFAPHTHPPAGAVVLSGGAASGYDGQFYYVLARDPLLLHHSTLADLGAQAFRANRIGYPALAALVSRGAHVTLPLALLSVNVAVVLALTAGFALYLRSRGRSGLWALALGLLPGFLLATLRDLTDPLATAAALGGVIAYTRGRRWPAGVLLGVAVLTRDVMALVVVAVALDGAGRAWRERRVAGSARRVAADLAPVVVIPAIAFVGWRLYVASRNRGALQLSSALHLPTFDASLSAAFNSHPQSVAVWDVTYQALMLVAVVVALFAVWRNRDAFSIGAALMALSLFVAGFQPVWGDTRDSLPVFALLLTAGLVNRRRLELLPCVAAAAMTALIPFAIPGVLTG